MTETNCPRVLVLECRHDGHRYTTVRRVLDSLQALPISIDLAISRTGKASAVFSQEIAGSKARFDIIEIDGLVSWSYAAMAWTGARALSRLVRKGIYSAVYVPYADGIMQFLPIADPWLKAYVRNNSVLLEGILMGVPLASGVSRWPQRQLARLGFARSAFTRLHCTDPGTATAVAHSVMIPDPTIADKPRGKAAARSRLGLSAGDVIAGCAGMINERKGIDLLIEAFRQLDGPDNYRLLLAGHHSKAVRRRLAGLKNPSILSIDRYLSGDEFADAIAAMDLVVTPYPAFESVASICVRAAGMRRPCLASDTGWMGEVISQYDLGKTVDVTRPAALIGALGEALLSARKYQPSRRSTAFNAYFQPGNFDAHLTRSLCERFGFELPGVIFPWPPAPELRRDD